MMNQICDGCGKTMNSGTGCLCSPGRGRWREMTEEEIEQERNYYKKTTALSDEDDGRDLTCSCGAARRRAPKAPRRAMPCGKCGDEGREATELLQYSKASAGRSVKATKAAKTRGTGDVRGSGGGGDVDDDVDDDMDAVLRCTCGAVRDRATMAPDRVLPCDKCEDDACDVVDLRSRTAAQGESHGVAGQSTKTGGKTKQCVSM
eukprot:GFYU01007153.1.p1 GENE.GFYU01007153.1~~GFYU01007153.1.p1  ORF type:complete len:204 (-),score=43.82 GFYU01007153.1:88-699(-)